MQKYCFRQCTLTQLDDDFGLRQVFVSSLLDHWLEATVALSDYEKGALIPGIESEIELSAVYGTYVIDSDWRFMVLEHK